MAEGTLFENLTALQGALSVVTGLLGESAEGDQPGSKFAGASSLAALTPTDRVAGFQSTLSGQLVDVLDFDTASISGVAGIFQAFGSQAGLPPAQAMTGFEGRLQAANAAALTDLIQGLGQALQSIESAVQNVPQNRTAVVGALLDQVLGVLGSLDGPEAQRVQAWIQSVQAIYKDLAPLLDALQSGQDPSEVFVQVITRSVESTLDVFGFGQVKRLLVFFDEFPANAITPELLQGASTALGAASGVYNQVQLAVGGAYPAFRDAAVTAAQAMVDLRARMRPVMSGVRRVSQAKILQPGALHDFLRQQMEDALGVQVHEVQEIEDPFNELFDRIDAAIGEIDLDFVRTDILGFFDQLQQTITAVDIPSLGDTLQEQLTTVESAIQDVQQGVTDLLDELRAYFDELLNQLRALASQVGTFQPDGSFQYHFEADLRRTLASARLAIGGDPNDPGAPSVKGALDQFQSAIDQFLSQLNGLLEPLEAEIETAKADAVAGINEFSTYLDGLDVPGLVDKLQGKVQEIVDALVDIDFDLVIDPVVAAIEENTKKLNDVDAESLNELLREALRVALEVIISIDFTNEISAPLSDGFAEIKKVPAGAIEALQSRYEQALELLDEIKPQKLLEALFGAIQVIDQAIGSLEISALLRPLDDLHKQYLVDPLELIKPSTLLKPATDEFEKLLAIFDTIQPESILEPIDTLLQALKAGVAQIDLTGWLDDLIEAIEKVKATLRSLRPSELLQPLVADLERLEGELDRFKPSVLFAPVAELAAPLLQALDAIQQQTVEALHQVFQLPLQLLERLNPQALADALCQAIDQLLAALRSLDLPARYNQLKGQYFDLKRAVQALNDPPRLALIEPLNPDRQIGPLVTTFNDLLEALEAVKGGLRLDDLGELYQELQERLLAMLPPYARELLDVDTFKRLMRLADPTRFLEALDERFDALKAKLLPIRPDEITGELDETYEAVLAQVENLDIQPSLEQVRAIFERVKGILDSVRVDFLSADLAEGIAGLRAMADGLDPARFVAELDGLYQEVESVVESAKPSLLLAGLGATLAEVKDLVKAVDPRTALGPPLDQAWQSVQGVLDQIDFTVILSPLVDKLDGLEDDFLACLGRTEGAFDEMLGAAQAALA